MTIIDKIGQEKFVNFSTAGAVILLVLCLLTFTKSCSISSEVEQNRKTIKVLSAKIDSLTVKQSALVSQKEFDKSLDKTLYKFLIFEDDIDKGKMSLSQLQLKLDEKSK